MQNSALYNMFQKQKAQASTPEPDERAEGSWDNAGHAPPPCTQRASPFVEEVEEDSKVVETPSKKLQQDPSHLERSPKDSPRDAVASPIPEREGSVSCDVGTAKLIQAGYGPTLNGIAAPLVDAEFNEIFVDEGVSFIKLDMWIFNALGQGTRTYEKGQVTKRKRTFFKSTPLGKLLMQHFDASLGPHSRTHAFVNNRKEPVEAVVVNIQGVDFEFLPSRQVMAVRYTHAVLDKLAELARCQIEGTLAIEATCAPTKTRTARIIEDAAKDAIDEHTLEVLTKQGIKYHPSKMRFIDAAGSVTYIKVPRARKNKFKKNPNGLKRWVQKKIYEIAVSIGGLDREGTPSEEHSDSGTESGSRTSNNSPP